jgi:hypothetical protein
MMPTTTTRQYSAKQRDKAFLDGLKRIRRERLKESLPVDALDEIITETMQRLHQRDLDLLTTLSRDR